MANKHIDVKIEGVQKILRKLNKTDPVIASPWTKALHEASEIVLGEMRHDAPGDLGSRITYKMQTRPVPLWAHVGLMPMPNNKGFRYPGAMHGAVTRYHYRSGPKRGQNTHGWLTKSLVHLQGKINAILGKAANQIKTEWDK